MNAPFALPHALRDLARRSVPRYTSYPTAPHFTSAVTAEVHAEWLRRVARAGSPVSLYLHIPFCRTICNYCGCTTKASLRDEPIRAYAAVLHHEIALLAAHLGRAEVSRIHWGGGTPNILPPDCFEAIVRDLGDRFAFRPDMEHAVELDPRHVTPEGARALASLGVNRASLGVQTLDPAVQAAIGRVQPLPTVRAAFESLRSAGIEAINADLMYGLPFQDDDSVAATAELMLSLAPSRFAIFGYAHVPWMKTHQRLVDEAALPGPEERLSQAAVARRILEGGGYVEIGMDHFAHPDDPLSVAQAGGRLRRNFQGYTDDDAETLVGIGASSISRMPWGYAQNAADVPGWRRAIEEGRFAIARGKAFDGQDAMRADAIEAVLCRFEVDLAAVAARHSAPVSVFDEDVRRLRHFVNAGWVDVDGSRVSIRVHRHEIARLVASEFDAYLGHGGKHSVAV
ncbi:oxygen-independent coproporphyrinogen III oxidase [Jeongeupella avenae]|uniref:Oxygen-independent coproporphyrinogen III oxidase n=2 Tax=Antarcticirhabdus aurantiaca TaxID=2606717 RepID=A0ACD4NX62_9HYPH|nr:oxygen-independent coproporphyrinogen III oxidase [Antarcticirhabdus aurantiaca]WAJ31355.1 oxygen-independent coproporphyrinogen III oxidase [Jeongeuplla avenae]